MNIYLWLSLGCVTIFSLIAALAMLNEIITALRARVLPKSSVIHTAPVTIIIYVTDYAATLASVRSALALTIPHLHILVVDGNAKPSACRALRTAIREYHDSRLSVYAKQKPLNRSDTILSAIKRIPRMTHILVVNSGDAVDECALQQLTRSVAHHHRLLSIDYSTSVFLLAFTHIMQHAALLLPPYARSLPSGTALTAPHLESLRHKLYRPVALSAPEKHPFSRYRLRSLLLLLLAGPALLGLSLASLYTSATLHITQPLLLLGVAFGYVFIVSILEAPFLHTRHKLQLMSLAPICSIVLPVSLCIMATYELIRRITILSQPTAKAAADSDSSLVRA